MSETPDVDRRSRTLPLLGIALLIAIALAALWHAVATESYARSFDYSAPLARRAAVASWAARLEPFNARYTTRARVMAGWEKGRSFYDQGDYLDAVDTLAVVYRQDVGDQELLLLFKDAQKALSVSTTGKAHVQHGHDAPGEKASVHGDAFPQSQTVSP